MGGRRNKKRYIKINDNDSTTYQNIWDTAKAVIRGRFISLQAYLPKQERAQISDLTLHLKKLKKEERMKPKVSRRKEMQQRAGSLRLIKLTNPWLDTLKKKEKKHK